MIEMSKKGRYFGSEACIKDEQLAYPCWLFSFGSIAGWMLEVVFRSVIGGAFCNSVSPSARIAQFMDLAFCLLCTCVHMGTNLLRLGRYFACIVNGI